jgi:hypothetical protein
MFGPETSDEVERLVRELRHLIGELRPDAVPLDQAATVWSAFDAIERLAGAAKTLLASRVEESGAWQREGHRSAADHLARRSGTSVAAARDLLATSGRLAQLPATEAALRPVPLLDNFIAPGAQR